MRMPSRSSDSRARPRLLVDFWYASELKDIATPFQRRQRSGLLGKLIQPLSALSILRGAGSFDYVAPNWYEWGRLVVVLNALLPRPRPVMLFEVIDYSVVSRNDWKGWLYRLFVRTALGPAMRRTVTFIHVMTEYEHTSFARLYGLDDDVIHVIPWPLLGWVKAADSALQSPAPGRDYVFSSGRASCDWPTLFAAARDQGWRLVVVCSRSDLALVQSLNERVGARILSEISKDEHDSLLAGAAVCVISLREDHKSAGQVRLGAAIELDIPVVASEVDGLKGYLLHGVNALAFPAGDPSALRHHVGRLLADTEARRALTVSARTSSEGYDRSAYFRELGLRIERAHLPHRD